MNCLKCVHCKHEGCELISDNQIFTNDRRIMACLDFAKNKKERSKLVCENCGHIIKIYANEKRLKE